MIECLRDGSTAEIRVDDELLIHGTLTDTPEVNEQHEVVGSLPSLIKQRRDVFNNDGGLDTINENEARSNIRLIRRSKSPQKTAHPVDNKEISVDSGNLCPSPG